MQSTWQTELRSIEENANASRVATVRLRLRLEAADRMLAAVERLGIVREDVELGEAAEDYRTPVR